MKVIILNDTIINMDHVTSVKLHKIAMEYNFGVIRFCHINNKYIDVPLQKDQTDITIDVLLNMIKEV
jgi:hypothetical protein